MEVLILIGLTAAVMCFILLDTDAPEMYLKLFNKDNKLLHPTGVDASFDLPTRLGMKSPDSFFVSLITCGTCLSVWIASIFCLIAGIFSVIKIGAAVFVAWVAYFSLLLLLKALNHE